ncbi:hypothetical protein NC651_032945 [Populus alba x Populus x berolinensis]|nr:hypothetical protein NC651_032945 [Populus alba x Populus x berolinensis]
MLRMGMFFNISTPFLLLRIMCFLKTILTKMILKKMKWIILFLEDDLSFFSPLCQTIQNSKWIEPQAVV